MTINYAVLKAELAKRFNTMAHLVTEDLIRQWFIETQNLSIGDTVIEKPYRLLKLKANFQSRLNSRARADFHYNGQSKQTGEKEDVVIEFKYHKKSPYSDTAKTTNMGEAFRDLNRLSTLANKEKYFIYVFDQEMKDYYDKHVFDILKVDANKGKTLKSSDIETLIKGKKTEDFKNTALSSFDRNMVKSFDDFNYTVDLHYSDCITTYKKLDGSDDKMYIIIVRVK
ncbi:MAG: hypothetical protein E7352_06165 [Clostridiales bacterium]|nr:hypothetical protein [Clostridiales bacterium]MBE5747735.1 hypothetical protein [Clostridiales bacterium]